MINIYNLIGFTYLDYFNDRCRLFKLWPGLIRQGKQQLLIDHKRLKFG